MNKQIKDMTGLRFGRLKVLNFSHTKDGKAFWECECDCGNHITVNGRSLRRGTSKSCGCIQKKHGEWNTKLYAIWNGMIRRCHTSKSKKQTKYYKDKGIKVCDEWRDFIIFKEWALSNGYIEGLSIERIDINDDYKPSNCKWIPLNEQQLNQRHTTILEINGIKKPLTVWARENNIHPNTLRYRINKGWKVEDLFKKPQ